MNEVFYSSVAAGVSEIKEKLPGRCNVTVDPATFQHIVTVRPNDTITLEFVYNEWYPSRVPEIRVKLGNSKQNKKREKQLEQELKAKAKGHEYLNTLMIPMLVEYLQVAVDKPSRVSDAERDQVNKTSSKAFSEDDENINLWAQPSVKLSSPRHATQSQSIVSSDTWGDSDISRQVWSIVEPVMEESGTQMENLDNWGSMKEEEWIGASLSESMWSEDDDKNSESKSTGTKQDDWKEIPSRKKKSKQEENKFGRKVTSAKNLDTGILASGPPNYFVAVRCTNPSIGKSLEEVVTGIISQNPAYDDICYNKDEIHVTLCTLALNSQDQIDVAIEALQGMKAELISSAPKEPLKIDGISEFNGGKVVYAKVHCQQDFLNFRTLLMKRLKEEGVPPTDTFEYTPHMTIGKINKSFLKRNRNLKIFGPHLYNKFVNKKFGFQKIKGVHLCKMGSERREDGYYTCPTEIMF